MPSKRKHPYLINVYDIPEADVYPVEHLAADATHHAKGDDAKALLVRQTYGTDMSFMLARRIPGFHSTPHIHDAEQMNYVLEGAMWIFVGEDGFYLTKGDILRIPRNHVHWALVEGPEDCFLLTAHHPPLIGETKWRTGAHSLLGPDEDPSKVRVVSNEWVRTDKAYYQEIAEIERRVMARERTRMGLETVSIR